MSVSTADISLESEAFQPVRLLEVELSQTLPAISAYDAQTGCLYKRAQVLVRLHTQPLGLVDLNLTENGLDAAEYVNVIWQALHPEINEHLRQDGLAQITGLSTAGIAYPDIPPCLQERAAFLSNAPFVSVVVATRNRTAMLAACLDSLLSLEYPHYEIIVVDNAPSTSETADLIAQKYHDLPQVRYVREDRPGLARAHNRGLVEVEAPIVAFTDDDVVADTHWLAEIAKGFDTVENVACVTGMVFPVELETFAQMLIEHFGGFNKGFTRRIFDLSEYRPKEPLYPYTAGMFGSGANMAFKTSALRDIGGFDPALGAGSTAMGGDDLSSFFEVIMSDYRLVYQPTAIIRHWHHREYAGLRRQLHGYGVGLTAYLMKSLMDRPRLLFDLLPKVPRGLYYALNAQSPKNIKKQADYPRELTNIERRGMLYGPFAYLRSRWQSRIRRKQL